MAETNDKPVCFFKEAMNQKVIIKLNDGYVYRGELKLIDGLMNVVLQNVIEYINSKKESEYPECFIRGINICYISLDQ